MRCPDCNKFVSYGDPEVEMDQDPEISGTTVSCSATVKLQCGDCSTDLKDANIDAEIEIEHECKEADEREEGQTPDEDFVEGEEQFVIENEGDPEGTDRTQTKDRYGKPIKMSRYMKRFYGFKIEPEIKCRKCGEVFTVTLEGEEQASGFNECC